MLSRIVYISLIFCLIFAFAMSYALQNLVEISLWYLLPIEAIFAVVFSSISLVIGYIIHFGNFSALTFFQKIINYLALGVLAVGVWLVLGYNISILLFEDTHRLFLLNTLWIRGIIGVLLYLILIQYVNSYNSKTDLIDDFIEENKLDVETTKKPIEIIERIAVKSGQKIHVILIPQIIYIQSEGDYVKIFTTEGKYLKEETMKYFQEHLPEKLFVRVHRSYIVNIEMIQRIEVFEKNNQLITLKNGEKVKVSTTGYKLLKTALDL